MEMPEIISPPLTSSRYCASSLKVPTPRCALQTTGCCRQKFKASARSKCPPNRENAANMPKHKWKVCEGSLASRSMLSLPF